MSALFLSIIFWLPLIVMISDEHCRKHEKNAIKILVLIVGVLTVLGIWTFDLKELPNLSLHDFVLLGFLPILYMVLYQRKVIAKKQSELTGGEVTPFEIDLDIIRDKALVKRFRSLNTLMWIYAIVMIAIHFGYKSGIFL